MRKNIYAQFVKNIKKLIRQLMNFIKTGKANNLRPRFYT